jgi:hypothetical protein
MFPYFARGEWRPALHPFVQLAGVVFELERRLPVDHVGLEARQSAPVVEPASLDAANAMLAIGGQSRLRWLSSKDTAPV